MHLRRVSRIGHSQAVSMWAWPIATARCRSDRRRVLGSARPNSGRTIRDRGGDIGEPVESRFDRAQQLHPARVVEADGAHHAVEHLEVVGERLGVGVDHDEFGATEPVDRRLTGGVERAERRRSELRECRVRRRLEQQRDVAGRVVERVVGAPWMDALQRP